jgi:hypothetical protein
MAQQPFGARSDCRFERSIWEANARLGGEPCKLHTVGSSFDFEVESHERINILSGCGRLLAVTAAHVFNGYLADKRRSARTICRIGTTQFDPERRLVGLGSNIDIATFDFTYDDLRELGKQAIVITDATHWPPPHPFPGQAAFFAGFPGASRIWLSWRSVSFGLYTASPRINSASDRQITCPFEREQWIDVTGRGLPPRGFKLGGLSGGPLLIPLDTDGVWDFNLGGVISEAPRSSLGYETLVVEPAHFIAPDGTIYSENSAPIRHAVPAAQVK